MRTLAGFFLALVALRGAERIITAIFASMVVFFLIVLCIVMSVVTGGQ